ncbi:MAG: hypothetical protein OIF50_00575 [Flavobacteriaceae bacterium]|nr:hypothetical protein [Flavobacteriaceae bacterium]
MSDFENKLKEQEVRCAKKIARLANETSINVAEVMETIDKNNASMASFPLEFISFAERIANKLSNQEVASLTMMSQKMIEHQKLNNENFRLIVELADMQRQRMENALDDFRSVL